MTQNYFAALEEIKILRVEFEKEPRELRQYKARVAELESELRQMRIKSSQAAGVS